jgi:hypothetical protein
MVVVVGLLSQLRVIVSVVIAEGSHMVAESDWSEALIRMLLRGELLQKVGCSLSLISVVILMKIGRVIASTIEQRVRWIKH